MIARSGTLKRVNHAIAQGDGAGWLFTPGCSSGCDEAFARARAPRAGKAPADCSRGDIACVREIVSRAEYGDALVNLVAIGEPNGKGFGPDDVRRIAELSKAMGMDTPPLPKRGGDDVDLVPAAARSDPRGPVTKA